MQVSCGWDSQRSKLRNLALTPSSARFQSSITTSIATAVNIIDMLAKCIRMFAVIGKAGFTVSQGARA